MGSPLYSPPTAVSYLSPLHERARKQLDTYWRVRVAKAVEALEREARRMLQLEAQLAAFSQEYYTVVGPWAEYLAGLEAQLEAPPGEYNKDETAAVPLAAAQRDLLAVRQDELKARYRQLALEIHPDRNAPEQSAARAAQMQLVNSAYAKGDLAALLRCEAEIVMSQFEGDWSRAEGHLRDLERASETYAAGYRTLLNSPLNHLMLRSMAATREGWDWMGAVVNRMEHAAEACQEMLSVSGVQAA